MSPAAQKGKLRPSSSELWRFLAVLTLDQLHHLEVGAVGHHGAVHLAEGRRAEPSAPDTAAGHGSTGHDAHLDYAVPLLHPGLHGRSSCRTDRQTDIRKGCTTRCEHHLPAQIAFVLLKQSQPSPSHPWPDSGSSICSDSYTSQSTMCMWTPERGPAAALLCSSPHSTL